MVNKVIELRVEHVLLFVILVFLLYHFMGSSRCVNRFRVGGVADDVNTSGDICDGLDTCRLDPTNPEGPVKNPTYRNMNYPHQPYCNQFYNTGFEITKNLDIANCQLSDARCFWDFNYKFNGSGRDGTTIETPYGACRSFCNASTVVFDENNENSGCYSIKNNDIDAEKKCNNTKVSNITGDPNEFYNCIWGPSSRGLNVCQNPYPPDNQKESGYLPCEIDIESKFESHRICPINKWAPKRFYRSDDDSQKYCDCPLGYNFVKDENKDLYRCIQI